MADVRQALGDGANALQAMRRPGPARALRWLREDLRFVERILVIFLRRNVDDDLRASSAIEDKIRASEENRGDNRDQPVVANRGQRKRRTLHEEEVAETAVANDVGIAEAAVAAFFQLPSRVTKRKLAAATTRW